MKRIVGLLAIALLAMPLALYSFWIGALPYGNSNPGGDPAVCVEPEALPPGATAAPRDPRTLLLPDTMKQTWFPLGIVCTVQLVSPSRTEVIPHQSWPATIAWLGFFTVAVLMTIAAILETHGAFRRRRWGAPLRT